VEDILKFEEKETRRGGPPCELILISGFLGAGKTTFLRNILSWSGDLTGTAVLVNEFGQVGIDGDLLDGFHTPVVQLTNGCICCTMKGDLVRAVRDILEKARPRRVIIEATGVADPLEIQDSLRIFQVEGTTAEPFIVTVLDADLWEGREYFGPVFHSQIKGARLLLFNKVDLLPEEVVADSLREVREMNPFCILVATRYGRIDPELLQKASSEKWGEALFSIPDRHTHGESAGELGYVAFSFEHHLPFKAGCFERFMELLPKEVYRIKGYVLLGGDRYFMNYAGGKAEWKKIDPDGKTKLAFVGWDVSADRILEDLDRCLGMPL
jgi:G3E family GTPase